MRVRERTRDVADGGAGRDFWKEERNEGEVGSGDGNEESVKREREEERWRGTEGEWRRWVGGGGRRDAREEKGGREKESG